MVHSLYQMVHNGVNRRGRPALLQAAISYVGAHGLHDRSLRELAAAIGTSHRMLIYHFGSKEGLMRAMVEEVEAQQRQFFSQFAGNQSIPPLEAAWLFWKRVSDPALANNVRLFFELYGQALQDRPGTENFLDRIVDDWIDPIGNYQVARGVPRKLARADARLGVAVTRGLLLDLVATGNRSAVDAAYRRYLELVRTWESQT